jgi:hypothetical protein
LDIAAGLLQREGSGWSSFNPGNGVVGGIAAPLGLYLAWILSVWWLLREGRSEAPVTQGLLEDPVHRG